MPVSLHSGGAISSLSISIKDDLPKLQRQLRAIPAAVPRVTTYALNRTATTVRAEAARAIKAEYSYWKIGLLKRGMRIVKANFKRLVAQVIASGRAVPISKLVASVRQTSTGAKAGRLTYRGAFVARMRSGHVGIFRRGKAGDGRRRRKSVPRRSATGSQLPIDEVTGIAIPKAFAQHKIEAAMRKVVADRFPKEFARRAAYELAKVR